MASDNTTVEMVVKTGPAAYKLRPNTHTSHIICYKVVSTTEIV